MLSARNGSGGGGSVRDDEVARLTIPVGTSFQFRAADDGALRILAAVMPPWPGPDEAYQVDGPWAPGLRF